MGLFRISLVFWILFTSTISNELSGQGKVYTSLSVRSELLKETKKYSIYLPPDYSEEKSFSTLYLLHGFGGDETSWVKRTNFQFLIDSMIINHTLKSMIIIMPDGGNTYYINDFENKLRYEDFFIEEFIPHINNTYKVNPAKNSTAIGGMSMGGFGAALMAIKHPDLFGTVICLSGALRTPEQFTALSPIKYKTNFSGLFGTSLAGENRITQHWKDNSPYYLTDSLSAPALKTIDWYIDCGNKDFLLPANIAFHELFLSYDIPHEFHIREGSHSWEYWQKGFLIAIKCWTESEK